MWSLIWLAVSVGAAAFGFYQAREFVRRRLTYVDAAQRPLAPVLAGVAAALIATPVVWILPLGVSAAVLFGLGVGAGVAAGSRANRKRLGDGSSS
jgi:hypothetical protein